MKQSQNISHPYSDYYYIFPAFYHHYLFDNTHIQPKINYVEPELAKLDWAALRLEFTNREEYTEDSRH